MEAFVDVKMQRADISVALYKVATDVGGPALVKQTGQRLRKAIEAMLLTAPDLKLSPDRFAIDMMLSAMSGAMRSALEAGASHAVFRKVREPLVLLANPTWQRRQRAITKLFRSHDLTPAPFAPFVWCVVGCSRSLRPMLRSSSARTLSATAFTASAPSFAGSM